MSEDAFSDGREILTDDLERFFKARGVTGTCPFCGTSGWGLPNDLADESVFMIALDRRSPDFEKVSIAAAVVIDCTNCGFVAHFMRGLIAKWLDENDD